MPYIHYIVIYAYAYTSRVTMGGTVGWPGRTDTVYIITCELNLKNDKNHGVN